LVLLYGSNPYLLSTRRDSNAVFAFAVIFYSPFTRINSSLFSNLPGNRLRHFICRYLNGFTCLRIYFLILTINPCHLKRKDALSPLR